jgi:beta-phosphoglucomutase-like phosphatase (HAD superfamily)
MIRAVIFDFNGVLVDDEQLHFRLFQEVLAEEGVAITEHDYHSRFLGLDDRGCFRAALAEVGQPTGQERLDDLIARKAQRYSEVAARGLRFFPGAAECLATLADRWPLAINSGALRPEIEFALRLIDRRPCVAAIVSAEVTTHCKPHPEGYTLALEHLRRHGRAGAGASAGGATDLADLEPGSCLVIEDSLAGIESAKRAGMWAVGVPNTYGPEQLRRAGADDVVPGLPEFTPEWIAARFHGNGR